MSQDHPHAGDRPDGRDRQRLETIARRAMLDKALLPDFSPAALAELAALASSVQAGDPGLPAPRDLRDLPWSSIDNDDSRDLDQLEAAERLPDGAIRVLVAVADVDSLVHPGSAIDEHARANTTSVYTSARIFPMLPERLSTDLTSLNDGADRPALVIDLTVGGDGSIAKADLYRAQVRNRCKLAYNAVAAWLDGEGPMPGRMAEVPAIAEQVKIQDEAAARLRTVRHEHGALDLETIEAHAVFDGDAVSDLREERKNRAKELIEDFMIAANGATARFLAGRGLPSLRRMVRTPRRWDRIVELAARYGVRLPADPDGKALAAFLTERRAADPDGFPEVSLSVIKMLGSGEYVVDLPGQPPEGHFGLAVRDYTHATAPNRRFPDLVTHRLLKAALAGRPAPYDAGQLAEIARHCTLKEDDAVKVERQVRKSAAALLLAGRRGEIFDAVVTGASDKGTWVRVFRPAVEGRLERGSQGLDVGDRLRVRLISTNVERGFIDFERVA
jgi:exoribonuclease-2